MLFDQEKIYQMLHKKDWIKVCENMFRTSKDLEHKDLVNDPMVQQVVLNTIGLAALLQALELIL